jgi:hypothetical protein
MIQRLIALGAVLLAVQISLAIIVNKESAVLEASSPDTLFLSLNPAEGIGAFNLASLTPKAEKGEEPSNEEQQ